MKKMLNQNRTPRDKECILFDHCKHCLQLPICNDWHSIIVKYIKPPKLQKVQIHQNNQSECAPVIAGTRGYLKHFDNKIAVWSICCLRGGKKRGISCVNVMSLSGQEICELKYKCDDCSLCMTRVMKFDSDSRYLNVWTLTKFMTLTKTLMQIGCVCTNINFYCWIWGRKWHDCKKQSRWYLTGKYSFST